MLLMLSGSYLSLNTTTSGQMERNLNVRHEKYNMVVYSSEVNFLPEIIMFAIVENQKLHQHPVRFQWLETWDRSQG